MKYYQQGDVLICNGSIPNEAKEIKARNGKLILAEGEATGHAHSISASDGVSLMELDGALFLSTDKDVTIKHEEHKPISIPPGKYKIGIVREWDHFAEEAREVRD